MYNKSLSRGGTTWHNRTLAGRIGGNWLMPDRLGMCRIVSQSDALRQHLDQPVTGQIKMVFGTEGWGFESLRMHFPLNIE